MDGYGLLRAWIDLKIKENVAKAQNGHLIINSNKLTPFLTHFHVINLSHYVSSKSKPE
jgi:hypothetical protein